MTHVFNLSNVHFCGVHFCGIEGNTIFGVGSGDGPVWLEQRRFMLKHLSDLGMGNKDTMEDVIEQEAEQYVDIMLRNEGPIKSKVSEYKSHI